MTSSTCSGILVGSDALMLLGKCQFPFLTLLGQFESVFDPILDVITMMVSEIKLLALTISQGEQLATGR
jgi:hypothetical protein